MEIVGAARRRMSKFVTVPRNLFLVVTIMVLAAVALAGGIWIGIAWALPPHTWPWDVATIEPIDPLESLRLAFYCVAGVGGVVALVIAYRKQRDNEAGAFGAAFAAAAAQLSQPAAPERIAAVHQIAALADQHSKRRQQCVDLLCDYLRLPFDPELESALTEVVIERVRTVGGVETRDTRRYQNQPSDRTVRRAILSQIRAHTTDQHARDSWSKLNFDLSDTYLPDCDLSGSTFSGMHVSFVGAWNLRQECVVRRRDILRQECVV